MGTLLVLISMAVTVVPMWKLTERAGYNPLWSLACVVPFGVIILLTGIAILSGADKWLEAQVVNVLPDAWVRATTLF